MKYKILNTGKDEDLSEICKYCKSSNLTNTRDVYIGSIACLSLCDYKSETVIDETGHFIICDKLTKMKRIEKIKSL